MSSRFPSSTSPFVDSNRIRVEPNPDLLRGSRQTEHSSMEPPNPSRSSIVTTRFADSITAAPLTPLIDDLVTTVNVSAVPGRLGPANLFFVDTLKDARRVAVPASRRRSTTALGR
jgi:hypothetical protein